MRPDSSLVFRRFFFLFSLFLFLPLAPTVADPLDSAFAPKISADVGLPSSMYTEAQLFQRDADTGLFSPVAMGTELADYFYVRWDFRRQAYVWCSGADRRPVGVGTKIQGRRLWLPGKRGLNWFLLHGPDAIEWHLVTDRKLPCMYRENNDGLVYQTGCAPADWESWGGELDPLPGAPSCRLSVERAEVVVGETQVLHWEILGEFQSAVIGGIQRDSSSRAGDDLMVPPRPGDYHIAGTVTGPGGTGTCATDYRVKPHPPEPPAPVPPTPTPTPAPVPTPVPVTPRPITPMQPTCTVTADPSSIRLGESLILSLNLRGTVTSATFDGTPVDLMILKRLKTPDRVGAHSVEASVTGPGGTSTCKGDYEVTAP